MNRLTQTSVALVATVALTACAENAPVTAPEDAAAVAPSYQRSVMNAETTGNHLVVFRGRLPGGFQETVEELGGRVVSEHPVVGAMLVTDLDADALSELSRERGVQYLEPEPVIYLPEAQLDPQVASADALPASIENPAAAFFFPRQWHLRAIHADQAWAAGYRGSPDVTVAILDTGLDYGYPDLEGRVDLSRSISLRPQDDALVATFFPDRHPITDLDYHGTHVASTVVSNGLVNAGVTSETTLIGVKVCSVYGGCTRIFEAIEYAVDNGADIINMSLGGTFEKNDYPGYVSTINRYINYTQQNGVLLVVSAGNAEIDLDHDGNGYKTYCDAPSAMCVSATGPINYSVTEWEDIDAPAYYTNYGRSAIDVAAPGGNASYVYAACSQTSLTIPICRTGTYVLGAAGTSMAAPHVSGVAAMVMAKDGTGNPAQTAATIRNSADDLGQSGTDPFYGKGRINAANAVGL